MPENNNLGKKVNNFFEKNPPEDIDKYADSKSDKEEEDLFDEKNLKTVEDFIKHGDFVLRRLDKESERRDKKSERKLREKNAKLAFKFSAVWAVFIGIIILVKGIGNFCGSTFLSQTEFLFVIGSLTTSIFTFYLLVLKYLFDKRGKKA